MRTPSSLAAPVSLTQAGRLPWITAWYDTAHAHAILPVKSESAATAQHRAVHKSFAL